MDVDDIIISSGGLDAIDNLVSHGNETIENLAMRIRDNFFGDANSMRKDEEVEGEGDKEQMDWGV